ncbi:MAG: histidine triad nucleotide-binding protein [Candidatus Omnitrophota bacterium]
MDKQCVFCKIIKGEIKAKVVFENDSVLAFEDIDPKAPVHILVIPKIHIEKISDLNKQNKAVVSDMVMAANEIAEKFKILTSGYRLVLNCGPDAGQAVFHIHMHLFGARKMNWPPG